MDLVTGLSKRVAKTANMKHLYAVGRADSRGQPTRWFVGKVGNQYGHSLNICRRATFGEARSPLDLGDVIFLRDSFGEALKKKPEN